MSYDYIHHLYLYSYIHKKQKIHLKLKIHLKYIFTTREKYHKYQGNWGIY